MISPGAGRGERRQASRRCRPPCVRQLEPPPGERGTYPRGRSQLHRVLGVAHSTGSERGDYSVDREVRGEHREARARRGGDALAPVEGAPRRRDVPGDRRGGRDVRAVVAADGATGHARGRALREVEGEYDQPPTCSRVGGGVRGAGVAAAHTAQVDLAPRRDPAHDVGRRKRAEQVNPPQPTPPQARAGSCVRLGACNAPYRASATTS